MSQENDRKQVTNSLPFRVCVRKRPLFSYEQESGFYDAVQTNYSHLQNHSHNSSFCTPNSASIRSLPPSVVTHGNLSTSLL